MSDTGNLVRVLQAASDAITERQSSARPLGAEGSAETLPALLREIDETVLPRILQFSLGETRSLTLRAGGRRLVEVTETTPAKLMGRHGDLLSAASDAPAEDRIFAFAGLFESFCEAKGALGVASLPAGYAVFSPGDGFALAELRLACGLAEDEPVVEPAPAETPVSGDDPLLHTSAGKAFFAACAGNSRGAVLGTPTGKILSTAGTEPLAAIEDIAKTCAKHFAASAHFVDAALPGSKLVLMASRAPDRPALACVLSGNELVVATADPGQIAALLAAWQRIDAAFPGA